MTAVPEPWRDLLEPDETVLWTGKIGFNLISSPVTILVLFALAVYAFWATWATHSLSEFCLNEVSASNCENVYWLSAPILTIITLAHGFAVLERLALSSGKAQGAILLTDRRLIRASDWPWRRARIYYYRSTRPRRGIGGVIRFGAFGGSVILPSADAKHVIQLMRKPGKDLV